MLKTNYDFLVSSLKGDIKRFKELIDTFKQDAERDKERGWLYGEGLNNGWAFALEYQIKNIERLLDAIGEVKKDDPQRTSTESVTR